MDLDRELSASSSLVAREDTEHQLGYVEHVDIIVDEPNFCHVQA